MARILKFIQPGRFDPTHTEALIAAYEKAVSRMAKTGSSVVVCEMIAKQIVEAARRGETDPDRLCQAALDTIGVGESVK
jgi:hypothetical protein